jgi:hypothetical protein
MKKHLLIAAVAATMTTSAMADISITGNGKFEYFNTDDDGVSVNSTNTEVNLGVKGKSGDTTVVLNLEFNTQGDHGIDVEDMYLTTKIGEASIKAGNYTTSTSAILGEIDNGPRANNKVTVSTVYNGVKIYGGNSASATGVGKTDLDNNMFLGISAKVGGFATVQAKRNTADISSFGVSGSMAGFNVRLETKLDDTVYYTGTDQKGLTTTPVTEVTEVTDSSGAVTTPAVDATETLVTSGTDVIFGSITKELSGVALGLAWIDADRDNLITEDDSSIFAVSNAGEGNSNIQLSAKKTMSGNVITVKAGKIGYDSLEDKDYTKLAASRALASGATLALSYTNTNTDGNADSNNDSEVKTFEADISVKF